jgi:ATP-dependent protease ClpP protease subunit
MKQNHIYIYGDIYNEDSSFASEYGVISLSQVVKQINSNQDAEELVIHIRSRGGDVTEGFAIHDVLVASGKKVTTIIEGLCASIATVIALAGSTRKMNENSKFFIHNPWGDPFNMKGYTADDYQKRAEEIRIAENDLLDFYERKTGADRAKIADMMKVETEMAADEALELKFITDIVETVSVNAFASLGTKPNNNTEMKNKNKLASMLKNALTVLTGGIVALDMTLKDGTAITVETDGDTPKKGDAVTANGEPLADGDHELADGTIISVAGGKITEVKAPEAEDAKEEEKVEDAKPVDDTAAQIAALQAEIKKSNETLAAMQKEIKAAKESEKELTKQIEDVVAAAKKVSSTFTPKQREFASGKQEAKDTKSDAASVIERRKQERKAKLEAAAK